MFLSSVGTSWLMASLLLLLLLFMIDESLGWNNYDNVSRRRAILSVLSTTISLPVLAETVGKDADCNDRSCLGVWDGLLADCPHGMTLGAGCVSSQDDTPGIFAEPYVSIDCYLKKMRSISCPFCCRFPGGTIQRMII